MSSFSFGFLLAIITPPEEYIFMAIYTNFVTGSFLHGRGISFGVFGNFKAEDTPTFVSCKEKIKTF
jgi:hypothetical protein